MNQMRNVYSPSSLSTYDPVDKARVVIVGDPGVGKTSLLHMLCHNEPLKTTAWTVGFSVDVKVISWS